MKYLVSAEEMKRYDKNTIQQLCIPSLVLMERAAYGVFEEIYSRFSKESRILVVAGYGNNGGDGLAAGRILAEAGFFVEYVLVGDKKKISQETKVQLSVLKQCGQTVFDTFPKKAYDIMIDALFGAGLSRPLEGEYEKAVRKMNESNATKVSVDIPSGIDADTGAVMGEAVRADVTVTFAFYKKGHMLYPGAEYTGDLVCKKIGITEQSFLEKPPAVFFLEKEDGRKLLPKRKKDGNKGTFGKVLVVAGSRNMSGASLLCAKSVYRMGAGLVKILTVEENREILQTALPEAILETFSRETFEQETLEKVFSWADCVVMGPGMGRDKQAAQIAGFFFKHFKKPLVADADALYLLSENPGWLSCFSGERKLVITPHAGEFAGLMKKSVAECKMQPFLLPSEYAKENKVCVVYKDARSVIAGPDGRLCLNVSGNEGMAAAGSGDVLCGMIGGLLAQGMPAFEGAALGAFLHGLAGDVAAKALSSYGVMAKDIIEKLPEVLTDILDCE